jgi:hypothetical protein
VAEKRCSQTILGDSTRRIKIELSGVLDGIKQGAAEVAKCVKVSQCLRKLMRVWRPVKQNDC